MLRKFATLVATLLLVGCSSTPTARDEAIIGIAVQYATAKYIEQKPGSAENIVRVAEGVKALVGGDATATLITLQEYVGSELDKLSLSPADRVLANALVQLIVAELQAKVGEGLLEPDQRVRVASILDLVIAVARA
jgi:type IV pilus biogenesis protein CpaD/CtpE